MARRRYQTERLQKGDVGYIPRGYGHSIENVGSGPARILIGFNAASTRPSVAMDRGKSQGCPRHESRPAVGLFGKFPDRDVIIVPKDGARWGERVLRP
ncbi:cupin domain-containing protein [Bradyrhizobium sp. AZCC 1588]|uniref:cupin domain-containing protein n=1 Tax=unclassified Bradyrhizobium TaxID=2631580 RepID=UPI003FA60797